MGRLLVYDGRKQEGSRGSASASFDAHIVLVEMYWGLPPP